MRNLIYSLLSACIILACSPPVAKGKPSQNPNGWQLVFHTGQVEIPIEIQITDSIWTILNADERIVIRDIQKQGNGIKAKLPLFDSTIEGSWLSENQFQGVWIDHSRANHYEIPVSIQPGMSQGSNVVFTDQRIYDVSFSKNDPSSFNKAVGVFDISTENQVKGTFLTESGDYRFLSGRIENNEMQLSCFDGAHLFHFTATVAGDSIVNGTFYSGSHWHEPFEGKLDPSAHLRDPDSLTTLLNPSIPFEFTAMRGDGEQELFDHNDFKGKVTIVQIWGSWCPNCTDESRLFRQLYDRYEGSGLQIIPVAFERTTDLEMNKRHIASQFKELGIRYPSYFGGDASKSSASQVFSALSPISSYPTCIFIDKTGKVRKIHTGFYGPGTGDHYRRHTQALTMFVEQLLKE